MATKSLPHHDPASAAPRWNGYTIDDLRYRRAVNHVKIEMARQQLAAKVAGATSMRALGSLKGGRLLGRLMSGLSAFDYALLAYQGARQAVRLYRLFHRR